MQFSAILDDGTVLDEMDEDDDWGRIAAIDVSVTAETTVDKKSIVRTVASRFFPRNVLSL